MPKKQSKPLRLNAIQEASTLSRPLAAQLLKQALHLHQNGLFFDAERLYEQILGFEPHHFDALQLLGTIGVQTQNYHKAKSCLQKALLINPHHASAHNNLGLAEQELGHDESALDSFARAINLAPEFAPAYYNRGILFKKLGRINDALVSFDRALSCQPNYIQALNNRGLIYQEQKEFDKAITNFDAAIAINQDFAEAHFNRANALIDLNQLGVAIAGYRMALDINPNYVEAHNNLGLALQKSREFAAAIQSFDLAISLKPNFTDALYNKANVLQETGSIKNAIAHYYKAIELKPDYAEAYCNLGVALHELQELDSALFCYNKAISLKPDYSDSLFNKSLLQLRLGNYLDGWKLYEYRWKTKSLENAFREYSMPLWQGKENLANKKILIWAEQGLGDTIQFCRYIKKVAALGAKVSFEVQEPLINSMANIEGVNKMFPGETSEPAFDFHCPLLSLPWIFETTTEIIPNDVPYIFPQFNKSKYWRDKLSLHLGLKVGLAWSSGFRENQPEVWGFAQKKNIPLTTLENIALPGIYFYSLQKGKQAEDQLASLKKSGQDKLNIYDYTNELNSFSDTAALIDNLDIIISVDTSVAHMAGAMGKPLLLLSQFNTDYRWVSGHRERWYPSAILFNQPNPGDWDSVVIALQDYLKTHL